MTERKGDHPCAGEEWSLPAGLAADGVGLLTLQQIADGAREVPFALVEAADRARIVAARQKAVGLRPWPSLAKFEWLALGFVRELFLGGASEVAPSLPVETPWPPAPGTAGRILVADARWDPFSQAARRWRRERLYPQLLDVKVLDAPRLSRAALSAALRLAPPRVLSLSGHGRADAFFGDAFELVLSADPHRPRLPVELRGVIVHLLACKCAQRLGPALVAAGATACIAYADDFLYDLDAPEEYFAGDGEIVCALAAGHPADEAVRWAKTLAAGAVQRLCRAGDPYGAAMLEFNRRHLCLHTEMSNRHSCPQ